MSEDYKIECSFCGKIHIPIWGKGQTTYFTALKRPDTITVPYTCPIKGNKGDVTFPYSQEIYQKVIVGWRN